MPFPRTLKGLLRRVLGRGGASRVPSAPGVATADAAPPASFTPPSCSTPTLEDQEDFARLSGDRNPMHVDPMAARRAMYGGLVVHGMNNTLRALESWARGLGKPRRAVRIERLVGWFSRPGRPGAEVQIRCETVGQNRAVIRVEEGPHEVVKLELSWSFDEPPPIDLGEPRHLEQPVELELHELSGRAGEIPLGLDLELAGRLFPALLEVVPAVTLAELCALTDLVGMRCPGLHSVFRSFSVERRDGTLPTLSWRVEQVDEAISRVMMGVEGPTLAGRMVALVRPEPQAQPSYAEVAAHVPSRSFSGQRALVVGGSRGLGEVTAKLLAAGGAEVLITWHSGESDAQRVADDIERGGGTCDILQLDVHHTTGLAEALSGLVPTHVYYFASPPIRKGTPEFDDEAFATCCRTYVGAFARVVGAARAAATGPLRVLYASTVAVPEAWTGFAEYAAAKAAGEQLCRHLEKVHQDLFIEVVRLPRLATDQTVSLTGDTAPDAVGPLLEILQRM